MCWHLRKPEADQGAAIFAVLLPGFRWKPRLLSLGDLDSSAGGWSRIIQRNHLPNGVGEACNARQPQNGTPTQFVWGGVCQLHHSNRRQYHSPARRQTPVPRCGASSQTFTKHQPLPAASGSLQPPAWGRGAKDGTEPQRSQKTSFLPGPRRPTVSQMTARPAAAKYSGSCPALGPSASDLGLQAGEKGERAGLDSRTAV